jgi:hypothetical protein
MHCSIRFEANFADSQTRLLYSMRGLLCHHIDILLYLVATIIIDFAVIFSY